MEIKDVKGLIMVTVQLDPEMEHRPIITEMGLREGIKELVRQYIGSNLIKDVILSQVNGNEVVAVVRIGGENVLRDKRQGTVVRFPKERT